MNKALIWIGAAVTVIGVALGFVKSGECGSVFQPRNADAAAIDKMLGQHVADCSTATDLTPFVWGLIVVGVVLAIAGIVMTVNARGHGDDSELSITDVQG